MCMHTKLLQSSLILCDAVASSLPGCSVRGILQARILEPCPLPGDLPDPRTESTSLTSPSLADEFFTTNTIWEVT